MGSLVKWQENDGARPTQLREGAKSTAWIHLVRSRIWDPHPGGLRLALRLGIVHPEVLVLGRKARRGGGRANLYSALAGWSQ